MNPVMIGWERMAELHVKYKGNFNKCTADETQETRRFLKMNVEYWTQMASLKNLSYLAHETDDLDEQHRICAAIEELERDGKTTYFSQLRGDNR